MRTQSGFACALVSLGLFVFPTSAVHGAESASSLRGTIGAAVAPSSGLIDDSATHLALGISKPFHWRLLAFEPELMVIASPESTYPALLLHLGLGSRESSPGRIGGYLTIGAGPTTRDYGIIACLRAGLTVRPKASSRFRIGLEGRAGGIGDEGYLQVGVTLARASTR